LYAYHLPLDIHPTLGNNAQLAHLLGIENLQPLEDVPNSIPMWGTLPQAISGAEFAQRINQLLKRKCLQDRKSTRLNSSHVSISYAVFCLKKKKKTHNSKYMPLYKQHIHSLLVLLTSIT